MATRPQESSNGPPNSNGTQGASGGILPSGVCGKEQGKVLIGVTCMLLTLCLASVGGRLLARRMMRAGIEADDHLAVAALVSVIIMVLAETKAKNRDR